MLETATGQRPMERKTGRLAQLDDRVAAIGDVEDPLYCRGSATRWCDCGIIEISQSGPDACSNADSSYDNDPGY